MPPSYRKRLTQRTRHILRGPIEVFAAVLGIAVIFSRPIVDFVQKAWEGLPWWVGFLILVVLVCYALVRAGYELWQEEDQARQNAERKRGELQTEVNQLHERVAVLERALASVRPQRGVFDIKHGKVSIKDDTYKDTLDYVVRGDEVEASSESSTYGESSERKPDDDSQSGTQ